MKSAINLLAFALILNLFCSCTTEKSNTGTTEGYRISGSITGLETGEINFQEDTVLIQNGKFVLEGVADEVDMTYLRINDQYTVSFILINETFDIEFDINDVDERGSSITEVKITGSAVNDEFKAVSDSINNTAENKRLKELFELSKTLENGSDAYKENYEALSDAREASRKVQAAYIKEYSLSNPDSYVAAFYMRFQANEVDQTFEEFEQIVEGFSEEVKKSAFHKPLQSELEGLRNVRIGSVAPDFTLKTDKGEDFTLSSLRGDKIVLVDFWASWCIPCRKSYPHLKEVYSKYKNKGFEVVAVTNDTDHDSWKKAIKDDELEWIQVADEFPPRDAGPPFTAKVITAYAAPYLPSTYLLDKEGKILAKHLHGEELDEKMKEIFGE